MKPNKTKLTLVQHAFYAIRPGNGLGLFYNNSVRDPHGPVCLSFCCYDWLVTKYIYTDLEFCAVHKVEYTAVSAKQTDLYTFYHLCTDAKFGIWITLICIKSHLLSTYFSNFMLLERHCQTIALFFLLTPRVACHSFSSSANYFLLLHSISVITNMFFVCLSCFGITKFVITEMLWRSVIFKTIMESLHTGRFSCALLYSTFSVDPQNFPVGANLYKKLPFFAILGAVSSYFKNHNGKIWHEGANLGLLPQAKFYKNHLMRYIPFGQIYTKKYQFWRFWRL